MAVQTYGRRCRRLILVIGLAAMITIVAALLPTAPGERGGSGLPGLGAAPASAHPCTLPGFDSVVFAYEVLGTPPEAFLWIRHAQVICGGPDDVHWDPVGHLHKVQLAPTVAVKLLVAGRTGIRSKPASLRQLAQLLSRTTKDHAFGWFGGGFGVRISANGDITAVTELYHP